MVGQRDNSKDGIFVVLMAIRVFGGLGVVRCLGRESGDLDAINMDNCSWTKNTCWQRVQWLQKRPWTAANVSDRPKRQCRGFPWHFVGVVLSEGDHEGCWSTAAMVVLGRAMLWLWEDDDGSFVSSDGMSGNQKQIRGMTMGIINKNWVMSKSLTYPMITPYWTVIGRSWRDSAVPGTPDHSLLWSYIWISILKMTNWYTTIDRQSRRFCTQVQVRDTFTDSKRKRSWPWYHQILFLFNVFVNCKRQDY